MGNRLVWETESDVTVNLNTRQIETSVALEATS